MPPRSTRGVPSKRSDPEYEAQRSRYPISRDSDKNISQATVAYNVSLYSNTVPRNVEEALWDLNWKKAMEEKILDLDKDETWEKCKLPKRKQWGVDGYTPSNT